MIRDDGGLALWINILYGKCIYRILADVLILYTVDDQFLKIYLRDEHN